jgi:predicted dehydrogenase
MINVLLIGPGRIGKKYLEVLAADNRVILAGVVGSSRDKACAVVPPGCTAYGSDELTQAVESLPAGSMVVVATSEWSHVNELSVLSGKDLYLVVEKPLVSSWSDYSRIREKLTQHTRDVFPCFTSRFDQRYVAAHALMLQQEIKPLYICSRRNTDYVTASRVFGKLSMPFWIVCHDIDLLRWFAGSELKSVRASSRHRGKEPGAKDFILAELTFVNGVKGCIESSWCSPPVSGLVPHSDFRILSEAGTLFIDMNTPTVCGVFNNATIQPDVTDLCWQGVRPQGNTVNMLRHFIDVVQGLQEPLVSHSDAVEALRTSEAIRLSLIRDEEVMLGEVK